MICCLRFLPPPLFIEKLEKYQKRNSDLVVFFIKLLIDSSYCVVILNKHGEQKTRVDVFDRQKTGRNQNEWVEMNWNL